MDATTIERLKHAQEVLGWMADGKAFQWLFEDDWRDCELSAIASQRVGFIMNGSKYRLKPAKTIRPFTEQEARVMIGCVVVGNDGERSAVCTCQWGSVALAHAASKRWHYHLPGDPDNLKPCWVEE